MDISKHCDLFGSDGTPKVQHLTGTALHDTFCSNHRPLYEFLAGCASIVYGAGESRKSYHTDQGMLFHPVRYNCHALTSVVVSVASRRVASPRSTWKA